jgi:hypothetical protein
MYTTSIECKGVLIGVLMVKSGIDPHMISWHLVWLSLGWDCQSDFC